MTTLQKEEFESKKLLADIGVQIAKGRSEISELQKHKEDFLQQREIEVMERVKAVLIASKDALTQVDKNKDELTAFHRELASFAQELVSWSEKLQESQLAFDRKTEKVYEQIDVKQKELTQTAQELKKQNVTIVQDRKQLTSRGIALDKKEAFLESREQALQSAFKELHT
jgi:hypothetical protein